LSAEIDARIGKDWQGDIDAYDTAVTNARGMSYFFADGLAAQFPQSVR
jgi:hypothetical protein